MKCHQYGISARVRQKSFRGENSGGFANFRLVSQVNFYSKFSILINRIRSDNDRFRHTFRSVHSESDLKWIRTPVFIRKVSVQVHTNYINRAYRQNWSAIFSPKSINLLEMKKKFSGQCLEKANVNTSHVNLKLSCREHKTKFLSTKSSTNWLDCQDTFLFLDKKKNMKRTQRGM